MHLRRATMPIHKSLPSAFGKGLGFTQRSMDTKDRGTQA
jgi:hypothetical protein